MTVVVSTGHSGTKWLADALTACGVPADHEVRFNHNRPETEVDSSVSVSWAAVPHIERLLADGEPVMCLIRDPLAVVRSIMSGRGEGFLRNARRPSTQFVREHRPDLCEIRPLLDRVVAFVATWVPDLGDSNASYVRVEDGVSTLAWVADIAGHDLDDSDVRTQLERLGTLVNSHVDVPVDIDWSHILATPHGEHLEAIANRHGYAS